MDWRVMRPHEPRYMWLAAASALLATACGTSASEQIKPLKCVELTEGDYVFADGMFSPKPPIDPFEALNLTPEQARSQVEEDFARLGYEWMTLKLEGDMAVLAGFAPNVRTKERGFATGIALVRAHDALDGAVRVIVDSIIVVAPQDAELEVDPVTSYEFLTCQAQLDDIFGTDGVQFVYESIRITQTSQGLLNQAALVAIRCEDYGLDIIGRAGSTDEQGFDTVLAAARGEAIRRYLERQGVNAQRMSVINYGEAAFQDVSAPASGGDQAKPIMLKFTR